ncbi:MAG: Ldh family oxidoreductase [Bacillati bacterium ANGP1]|uniref:Ldh family oxidoreductase n=1 Tax=Candidatus Segetimicrobium genomatis TaxID=2569760 RepID=A0A537LF97_9BACT|nr:MAG: Ldh family oxidoreductase [Terrabacteria group bacterium ANGP1]
MNLRSDSLRSFAAALLQTHGVSPRASAVVADALVLADMRGVASHGIMRLPIYLERLRRGAVAPDSTLTVLREMPAIAVVDAGNGLGIPAAAEAMRRAMAKAQEVGAAWVAVRNSNHFGMAAYFALMATHEGMIGLAMTNSVAAMAPFGAVERYMGTNPIAVAVPAGREPPLVMDMASSAAAWGKIALAAKRGTPIPEGWAMDDRGRPVTQAVVAQRAIMLPFGGPKGSALALVIEALAGVLSGAMATREVGRLYADFDRGQGLGHFLGAIAVGAFMDPAEFAARMERLMRDLRALRPAPGVERVFAPGEMEWEAMNASERDGVPVEPEVWKELSTLAQEYGVVLPEVMKGRGPYRVPPPIP